MTTLDLPLAKRSRSVEPWVMLTAYDALMARDIEAAGADWILVGDSLGRAVLGYDSENEVTLTTCCTTPKPCFG